MSATTATSGRKRARAVQRWAGFALAGLIVLLLADSAFLATAATPEGLVAPMLRAHLMLGAITCVALPLFVLSHVLGHRRHRNVGARRVGVVVAIVAGLGTLAGLGLWIVGRSRGSQALVSIHEAAFVVALAVYVLHRLRAKVSPALRGEGIAAGVAIVLAAGIWAAQLGWSQAPASPEPGSAILDPGLSEARTIDGHVLDAEALANTDYCAECHPAIAARWASSAHRFGSLNDPFYAATLALSQSHRSPAELGFCGGCHDPLLLLTGRMAQHPRPTDPGADAGITCLACHAIVEQPGRLGNGSYVVAAPDHYPGYDADDPDERERSRWLLRSKPAKHIASFAPPHLRSAEMCVGCHKAHIPPALNGHRWLRGQDEYDPWFDSGAGGHSARTFFAPAKQQRRCQDCHMPRIAAEDPAAHDDGTVADHAFLGANTALPRALGDEDWVARNQAFLAGVVSVDVGAVEIVEGEQTRRRLAPAQAITLPPGVPLTVDVVVRNRGSGHLFPGGIADLREVWLELTLRDDHGQALLASGWLEPGGALDPEAHRWNAVLLDREGEPLRVHEVEEAWTVLSARRIMLGASDVVRVTLVAPDSPATLELRVLDRKLPRDYVEFVLGEDAPAMPITVLAETTLTLTPGAFDELPAAMDAGPRLRDLGIAHLLRGDTSLARQAASAAAERLLDDPGPRLDLARAGLEDGALDFAEAEVRAADALAPGHPTAAWLLARIRAAQGDQLGALVALEVALAAFPRDRVLLVMKGEALFRLERDEEAALALEAALQIDPELLGAHALLARIRADQGDASAAAAHEAAWERVRPQSSDQVLHERARRADPALDRRANRQYLVALAPVPTGWAPAKD